MVSLPQGLYWPHLTIKQTHNIALVGPLADFVVSLGSDGRISSQGSVSDAFATDEDFADEVEHEMEALELDEHEEDLDTPAGEQNGKLVLAEEIVEGHVSRSACAFCLD